MSRIVGSIYEFILFYFLELYDQNMFKSHTLINFLQVSLWQIWYH